MKKNYSKPQTELITVAQANMICTSPLTSDRSMKVSEEEDFKWDDVN